MTGNSASYTKKVARALKISVDQLQAAAFLLKQGLTSHFVARYRKEETKSLDEVKIQQIEAALLAMDDFNNRAGSLMAYLEHNRLLTEELERRFLTADNLADLNDAFLPLAPRKSCLSKRARERGLGDLALKIAGMSPDFEAEELAREAVGLGADVAAVEEALEGARHIISEMVFFEEDVLFTLRPMFFSAPVFSTHKPWVGRAREEAAAAAPGAPGRGNLSMFKPHPDLADKYKLFKDFSVRLNEVGVMQMLKINEGLEEGCLDVEIKVPAAEALAALDELILGKKECSCVEQVRLAIRDAYEFLILPFLEREAYRRALLRARRQQMRMLGRYLREIVMSPPAGARKIIAVNPNLASGSKFAVLDESGKVLEVATIDTRAPRTGWRDPGGELRSLVDKHGADMIVVGTASGTREVLGFVNSVPGLDKKAVSVVVANTKGVVAYSVSETGIAEFPNLDPCSRGAVSIGRRTLDPLSELTKVSLTSIPLGNYQSSLDKDELAAELGNAMRNFVNILGEDVNEASEHVLQYVSGLDFRLAKNIVAHRRRFGPFKNRLELLTVEGMSEMAFDNCAGFLFVGDGDNPLDRTTIHPESYPLAGLMAADLGVTVPELMSDKSLPPAIPAKAYVTETTRLETVHDIVYQLINPGLDVKARARPLTVGRGFEKFEDLAAGMCVTGEVAGMNARGALVDFGLPVLGLLHSSEMGEGGVPSPGSPLSVGQKVVVWILRLRPEKRNVDLTMRPPAVDLEYAKFMETRRPEADELYEQFASMRHIRPAPSLAAETARSGVGDETAREDGRSVGPGSVVGGRFVTNPDWVCAMAKNSRHIKLKPSQRREAAPEPGPDERGEAPGRPRA
ncbi:MAG: helix-hairpin-helix domain-containing protein [Deltaproteobacteria bacterium]|jgi:uncharacterized protein|nr:helix-hairpin-helix domain-containing protein [Deltaproteobacteria bacterium]